jgi:hypothetical protein
MARESMKQIMSDASADAIKPHIIANNTIEYTLPDGERRIRLHHTDIVRFMPDGSIVANTGGWQTVTTKERLNRYLPGQIYSHNGVWIYSQEGKEYAFQDGLTIKPDSTVINAGPDPKETQKLRKQVRKYAKDYVKALRNGDVPAPNNGDCWGCLMATKDGRHPMGGKDHIMSHIEEKYYVPSLLVNALERFGASQAAKHNVACIWTGEKDKLFANFDFIWQQIEKMIARWCYQELGLAV